VPVHELATTEEYLRVLDGRPTKLEPDERFSYSNSGFVLLAVIAERVSGTPFPELVDALVCVPAGMTETAFLRSDELPASAALGYVEVDGTWRTNVFHLPVRGSGDGGAYTTVGDVSRFWRALFAGRLVGEVTLAEMLRMRSRTPDGRGYGLGFWEPPERPGEVSLEGGDPGVAFRSVHDPQRDATCTLVSNTREGIRAMWGCLQRGR
jgi:CubicO group peptidase (beta-lactamase class C family)